MAFFSPPRAAPRQRPNLLETSANPEIYDLSNGVGYRVSRWIAYDSAMLKIEDNGVEPDTAVPAENSFDDTHDYVLEAAIDFLTP